MVRPSPQSPTLMVLRGSGQAAVQRRGLWYVELARQSIGKRRADSCASKPNPAAHPQLTCSINCAPATAHPQLRSSNNQWPSPGALVQQDVVGLQVAVHDAAGVRMGQRAQHLVHGALLGSPGAGKAWSAGELRIRSEWGREVWPYATAIPHGPSHPTHTTSGRHHPSIRSQPTPPVGTNTPPSAHNPPYPIHLNKWQAARGGGLHIQVSP